MTLDNNSVTVLLVLIVAAAIVIYRLASRPKPPVPVREPQAQQILAEIQQLRDELRREATSNGFTVPADQEDK